MTIRIAGAAVLAMALAACGGGSGSGADGTSGGPGGGMGSGLGDTPGTGTGGGDSPVAMLLDPADERLGRLPAGFSVSYDPVADTVTFDDGTVQVLLDRLERPGGPTYRATGGIRALREVTASGDGAALAVVSRPAGLGGSVFARLADTELPRSGTARFEGSYRALYVVDVATSSEGELRGDAALTADFDSGTISGVISGRDSGTSGFGFVSPFADVILAPTAIADGAFAGTATGGAATGSSPTTTTPGSYSGLFTGATGQEVVGAVVIPHVEVDLRDTPFGAVTEYGIFVAGRTGP